MRWPLFFSSWLASPCPFTVLSRGPRRSQRHSFSVGAHALLSAVQSIVGQQCEYEDVLKNTIEPVHAHFSEILYSYLAYQFSDITGEGSLPSWWHYCTCCISLSQGLNPRPTRGIVKHMEQSWQFPSGVGWFCETNSPGQIFLSRKSLSYPPNWTCLIIYLGLEMTLAQFLCAYTFPDISPGLVGPGCWLLGANDMKAKRRSGHPLTYMYI